MTTCVSCGTLRQPSLACPHCGARSSSLSGASAAALFLGLAGCVGATTSDKEVDHTAIVQSAYGMPTSLMDTDTDADTDADTDTTQDGTYIPHSGHSGGGTGRN